jgi:transposase-like protein
MTEDYPRTLLELERRFNDEDGCRACVHERQIRKHQPADAGHLLPRVHRVISLLKRWLMGTHQGGIAHEHLEDYLNEFTFRFNRRTSASRGKLFYRLAQQSVQVSPVTFNTLAHHKP